MKRFSLSVTGIAASFMLSFLFLLLTAGPSPAQDGIGCDVAATLSAPGAGNRPFFFSGETSGGDPFAFVLIDGGETGGTIEEGTGVTITLDPTDGWAFGGIDCDGLGGLVVTNLEDGFTLDCVNAGLGDTTCVINLVSSRIANIPTLSEWGMIAAAAGLAMIGVFFAIRKRRINTV